MTSVISHIASSAQIALEGSLKYEQELHILSDKEVKSTQYANVEVTFKADIKQNAIKFTLVYYFYEAKETEEVTTDTIYSYNSYDMAEASVKFLLCQLLYKSLHSDILSLRHIKQLQNRFQEAWDIDIAII